MKRVFFVAGILVMVAGIFAFLVLRLQPVTALCIGLSPALSGARLLRGLQFHSREIRYRQGR